jgi:hypothetical protein
MKWPILASLPLFPSNIQEHRRLLSAAGFPEENLESKELTLIIDTRAPAPKELLPKIIALLDLMHKKGKRLNQTYFMLQESIKNHYRAHGLCLLYGDAEDIILTGRKKLDVVSYERNVEEMMKNCKITLTGAGLLFV